MEYGKINGTGYVHTPAKICNLQEEKSMNPDSVSTPRVLFICHGNICRSPMAEMILRDMARHAGANLQIDSAATSTEEIGNGVYPPARTEL